MEEGERQEKKLTVNGAKEDNRLLCRSGDGKRFFPAASVPLSTLQRNEKFPLALWTQHSLLSFPFKKLLLCKR